MYFNIYTFIIALVWLKSVLVLTYVNITEQRNPTNINLFIKMIYIKIIG